MIDIPIKQYIVLRTHAKISANNIHVETNIITIDKCSAISWWKKTSQNRHCGGLASTVVSQEGCDLTLVKVKRQAIDRFDS